MLRRACLAALALALPTAVLPAAAARAAEPTTFTLDRVQESFAPLTSQKAYAPATFTPHTTGGGASLSHSADNVSMSITVAPPAGQQMTAGTSFDVATAAPTASLGRFTLSTHCPYSPNVTGFTGTVTVHEATYADGVLTALALDYEVRCASHAAALFAGSIRHASDRAYALARVTVDGSLRGPVGVAQPLTVTVANAGTAATTAGAATLAGLNPGDYAIGNDGCTGVELAPGASCTVGLTFTPAQLGYRPARIYVPLTGYPRASGTGLVLEGAGVAAPAAPVSVRTWPVAGGTRLVWDNGAGEITSYEIHRRAGAESEWALVGTPQAPTISYTDTTMESGTSAQYAVVAIGPGGTSPKSAPADAVRAPADPVAGTVDALVLDVDAGSSVESVAHDAARGATVSRQMGYRTFGVAASTGSGSSSSVTVGVVPQGTYAVGSSGVPLTIHTPGGYCPAPSGTLTVTEALYDMWGAPEVVAASFAVSCFGGTVRGVLRWHTTAPYTAAAIAQPAGEWRVPAGTSADRTVTVTSLSSPLTFGAATVGGTDASYFSVVSNGCEGQTLADGATCAVVVRATMSGTQVRNATLDVVDGTARGSRALRLSATPTSVPGAPGTVYSTWRVGRARVVWNPPADTGNTEITKYRVWRQVGTATPVQLLDGMPPATSLDDAVLPGTSVRYGVAAANGVGQGPTAWSAYALSPAQEVVYAGASYSPTFSIRTVVPKQPQHTLVGDDGVDRMTPAVSPDGSLVAYSQKANVGYDIWIGSAAGGGTPRNLTGVHFPGSAEYDPAFSNDGKHVAFTVEVNGTVAVWTIPVGGGTPLRRGTGIANPSWLPDSRSLVVTDYSSATAPLLRIAPNNARVAISGTGLGDDPAVSPDGRWLAFTRYDEALDATGLAVVPAGGGTAKRLFDPTGYGEWFGPAWRGDGTQLAASYFNGNYVDLRQVSWNGTALAVAGEKLGHDWVQIEAAWRSVGLKLTNAPIATRTTATIGFLYGAPYTAATCRLDNGPEAPCKTSWTKTGLTAGTHTLVVKATGPGVPNRVLAHSWVVDLTAPTISVQGPSTAFATWTNEAFRYSGSDANGVVRYDARYRKAPFNGTFGALSSPAGWANTASTQLTMALTPGWEYCFSARARDTAGNVSGWSAERCVAAPLDDRSMGATGWSRATGADYYRSTFTATTVKGRAMSVGGVQAKRLALVATRCSTCGTVAVYMNGVLVANVNLAAATTQKRFVFALPVFSTVRSGTVVVKVTSSGKTVQVDGLGVRRT